jgi:hypothetical protein
MKSNRIKSRQSIYHKLFVASREQHICSCEKEHFETAILVHGSYLMKPDLRPCQVSRVSGSKYNLLSKTPQTAH